MKRSEKIFKTLNVYTIKKIINSSVSIEHFSEKIRLGCISMCSQKAMHTEKSDWKAAYSAKRNERADGRSENLEGQMFKRKVFGPDAIWNCEKDQAGTIGLDI